MPSAAFPRSRLVSFLTLAACVIVAGLLCAIRGQDANWDLQNYHLYDPWALVHGRLLTGDIAAAQLQTFHNPLLDLPFFAMVAAGWPSRLVAFVLAAPAGIAAFFLLRIVALLFPGRVSARRATLRVAAFAIGVSGAIGFATLGTTMNEWPLAMLVLAALWLLLRAIVAASTPLPRRPLAIAGLLVGIGSGLKLTAAPFALAMCIALALRRWRRRRLRQDARDAAWFAVAVAAGVVLALGWWSVILWMRFDNPLFPYFNDWFRSPWWDAMRIGRTFGPFTLEDWLAFPYALFRPEPFFVAEVPYRDARVPTLYTLALVAGAVSLGALVTSRAARRRASNPTAAFAPWSFVATFWLCGFLLWTAQYSIYRYTLPLELLSGALIVGLMRLLLRTRALPVAVGILALTIIGTTRWPDWGHVPFSGRWFEVQAPPLAPGAMVVMASDAPMGYLVPYLGESARYVGAYNSIVRPGGRTGLALAVARAIREHQGPLYSLSHDSRMASSVYAAHRLSVVPGSCSAVRSNMPGPRIELCVLEKR